MFKSYDLKERVNSLTRFNTLQEKSALLVDDDEPISKIVSELTTVKSYNENEAKLFLYKLREISVEDNLEMLVTCPHCNIMNQEYIDINKFYNLDVKKYYKDVELPFGFFDSPEDVINNTKLTDSLSLKEYNDIEKLIHDQNNEIFNDVSSICRSCKKEIIITFDIKSNFSKSTLKSIYTDYINISMYTNNGVKDIDSLYPFEREIYINLIEDKINTKE